MADDRAMVRAWAVLGRRRKGDPYTLDNAVIFPAGADRWNLESQYPGRVVAVEIRPLPHDKEAEGK